MLFGKSERRRSYVSQLICKYTAQDSVGHSSQGPKTLNLAVGTGTASTLSRIFYVQEPGRSIQQSTPHLLHTLVEFAPTFSKLSVDVHVDSPHMEELGTRNTS